MDAISRTTPYAAAWCLLAFGCQLTLNTAAPQGQTGTPAEGGGTASPSVSRDAGSDPPERDASVETSTGQQPSLAGLKHKGCAQAVPAAVPAEPALVTDRFGHPLLDAWTELSCTDAAYPTCEEPDRGPFPCYQCLGGRDARDGICAPSGMDKLTDLCVPLHDLGNDCWVCTPPSAKARACCLGLDVDCHDSQAGRPGTHLQACARHSDCEAGLLCVDDLRFGGSLCACPGEAPQLEVCDTDRFAGPT